MGTEQFSLKWNNHTRHLVGWFESLLQSESLVDVTLCCEGQSLRAHKLVLSACSPYFKKLFQDHSESHPIVILKDVKFAELRSIIQFMYKGEVEVDQNEIESLICTAEGLMIRGLAGSRSTVSGLQFPPPVGHDLTPRPEPPADQDRKRARSEQDTGGGGDPPPPLPRIGPPLPAPSNGEESSVIKRPKMEDPGSASGEENNSVDGLESQVMDAPSQLCQPELLTEESSSHDPQLQVALNSAGVTPQPMAMTSAQRDAMQQQMQMLQEYMMPMLNNLSMGMTMPAPGVDVISNAPPMAKAGMSGLSCNVCAMIMPDLPTLEQHLRIHEEEKPYKCLQCGQRYKYQSAYQRHIDMNHTARLPQEKPYRCEVCGQFFKYLKSFHKHRANHTAIDRILNTSADDGATSGAAEFPRTNVGMPPPPNPVPQMQMVGGASLTSEPSLVDPEFRSPPVTMAPRPLVSDNQGLALKDDDEEESNSVTITAIKTERPDTPPAGGSHEQLNLPLGVRQEQRAAAAAEAEPLEQAGQLPGDEPQYYEGTQGGGKSWICPYCLKGFRGKENLKLHIRTHTGEKPYQCRMCDKKFVGKSDLNRHLRVHTGEKPYECNVCYRRFARGDYLSKHMVTHSQSNSPQPPEECAVSPTDGTAGGAAAAQAPSPENGDPPEVSTPQ